MKTILFQGDSITDCGRSREVDTVYGEGYAALITAALGYEEPGAYKFLNRGIGGNRIVDLYARIKCDFINLKPDVLSIMIGVNDVWHEAEIQNGADNDEFFNSYCMLIEEIKEALPEIKIMILEPFVLQGGATFDPEDPTVWERFNGLVRENAAAAKRVAEKYDLPFIELQAGFDALTEKAPASYWLADGVHPTAMGHCFIKDRWLETFKTL